MTVISFSILAAPPLIHLSYILLLDMEVSTSGVFIGVPCIESQLRCFQPCLYLRL